MPSPRSRFELACRIGAFALIGWLLGASLITTSGRRTERASQSELESRLAAWTRAPSGVALHGDFAATPAPWAIDWMRALKRSGHAVTWSGSPPAVAMSIEALADPRGGARVDVAAPAGDRVALHDDASEIDSLHVQQFGGSVTVPLLVGNVVASVAGQSASAPAPDSMPVKSIVVVGGASWEGKFVVAALEERGWPVTARFAVAPNVDVVQAGANTITLDTSRVAVVVAIDTVVQRYAAGLDRFVRSGGGLVLAGPSALAPAAAALAPGAVGPRFRPAVLPRDTLSLGSTGFFPVASLKQDAVPLERRTGGVAVAARRVGAGRVIQVGYDDSWRWRMAGAPGSERAHREWWSRLVTAAAYAPTSRAAAASAPNSAPLVQLIDRVGSAVTSAPALSTRGPVDRRIILAAILLLLLMEWSSRRLRGRA